MDTRSYHIIGCGGIGGWLTAILAYTLRDCAVHLWDADVVEKHNLDRQRFEEIDIGQPKVVALAETTRFHESVAVETHNAYITPATELPGGENPIILVGVDNHPARKAALELADRYSGLCIIGCNDTADSEAYCYHGGTPGTGEDPRVFYPDILTSTEGDPLLPPCTGEEQARFPQLAMANMHAAGHIMWLLRIWTATAEKLDVTVLPELPVRIRMNEMGGVETTKLKELADG